MPVINRRFPGTEEIIGCLMGGVYVFYPLKEELSYRDFVHEVFNDFISSSRYPILDHEEMALNEETLRLHSEIYLNFINNKTEGKLNMPDGCFNQHAALQNPEFYALSCITIEYENGISLNWKYNPDIFSSDLIDYMTEIHNKILRIISQNPESSIKSITDNVKKDYTPDQYSLFAAMYSAI
jgi:regulator of sigma D